MVRTMYNFIYAGDTYNNDTVKQLRRALVHFLDGNPHTSLGWIP